MSDVYGLHALAQRSSVHSLEDFFCEAATRALATLPVGCRMFRVVELGVADGVNTGPFISRLLECASGRVDDIELNLVDLPANNWASLTLMIPRWVASAAAASIALHVRMAPCSFYNSYAIPASVDLIWAATALHWAAPGIVESVDVATLRGRWQDLPTDNPLRMKFETRITRDLNCLLARAATALRIGGCLVASPAADHISSDGKSSATTTRRAILSWFRNPETAPLAFTWIVGMNIVPLSTWTAAINRALPQLTLGGAASVPMDDVYWRDAVDSRAYALEHMESMLAVAGKAWSDLPLHALKKARELANVAAIADFDSVPRAERKAWAYSALFWAERAAPASE